MRLLLSIVAACVLGAAVPAAPDRLPAEAHADSLYDAQEIDSLFSFSGRMMAHARAVRDSVLLGRMTYHHARARLALRDPRAVQELDHALVIATAIHDSTGRMHMLGLKSFIAVNRGQLEESIALNEERIALSRALGRRGSEAWGLLLIGYAELHRENLARARASYEAAWRAFGDIGRPREQLTASIGLARALDRMGRFDEARTSYQRAWLTARELGDRNQEGDAINNLGALELEHGALSRAADYFDLAYRIKREIRAFDIANAARNVAQVDQLIGRYAHAESTLVEAMSLSTGGMLDEAMWVEIGRLRLAQDRYRSAAESFRKPLARRAELPLKTRIEALTSLCEALTGMDSVAAAVGMLDRELPVLARESPSIWRSEAYLAWSRGLRSLGEADRARKAAVWGWEDARARADSTRMVMAASELSLCERRAGNDAAAGEWFERARAGFDATRSAGDYQWREAQRAALAGALLESAEVLRAHPPEVSTEMRARRHFDFLQEVVSRTLLERVTDPRGLERVDPALSRPVTSVMLQSEVLQPGECFLALSASRDVIHVFAITRERFLAQAVDDRAGAVTRRLQNYSRLAARAPSSGAAALDAPARALGGLLLGGIAEVVRDSPELCIAMDGRFAGAPLETLVCPGESAPLLVSHRMVRVPSAGYLRYLRARAAPGASGSLLVVASGEASLAGARREAEYLARRYGAPHELDPERAAFLDGLSRFDAIHVASHVHLDSERPWQSGIQIRPQAAPRAGHSAVVPDSSEGPLAFSASDSSTLARALPDDPFVRASEIAARRTGARLVVLSACESALGRAAFAEGVLGMASAFVSAGCRTVVGSLWDVDDRATEEFMKRFYRELETGIPVASALQAAQRSVRREKPEPFYWAGFVVIGDGDVVLALRPRGPDVRAAGWALAGLTVVVSMTWVIWRRRFRRGRLAP
jgi:tetratricopeptide (TPR) repeat protein